MMRTAAAVHALSWGGLLVIVLIAALWIQHWITAERWKNLQEQTGTAVVALQNNLGPSVPFNLEKLRTLPEQLVMPDLQARFSSTTNPRHKLSLAFALAGFGKLDAAYLVSRIDDIAEADTRNYIRAMQANPGSALAALKTEALQCSDKSTWRRKAKLSISALALGDTELAQEMCVFESRPDPEQRTLFIDEFRHWDIDLMIVYDAVKRSDSPALRSGICLAVGQRPVESLQDIEKSSWQTLATQWFTENGDTSTHSAAGWLLRHWKAPIPLIRKPHDITPQRDWYVVKTSADTMLRIRPAPADASAIPNPIVKYTEQLRKLETAEAAELETPEFLETRAMACFYSGKLAEALNDFHRLTKTGSTERSPSILKYLTLTLARLGRADEARASLAGYLESDITASQRTCMQIQIGAWLGEIAEASRQLDSAIKEGPSDHDTLYRMATAAADCAQATAEPDPESSRSFRMRALDLLQTLSDLGYRQWDDLSQDADFAVLHGDERFTSIISTMKSPREFWVADREVTRGQFEAFMNDTDYDTAEKPVAWTGVDSESSPSADHPAQQVSWFDAVMYCNWLSHREGLQPCYERTGAKETGKHDEMTRDAWRVVPGSTGYRLLNESEWEYACRAGTTTEFSSGNDEGLLVAYCLMYPSKLTVCGEKLPNAWGVHDMHGNVWELCWDQYEESRVNHVLRRGAFIYNSSLARSAGHSNGSPANRNDDVGFRVARTPPFAPQTVPEARENLRN